MVWRRGSGGLDAVGRGVAWGGGCRGAVRGGVQWGDGCRGAEGAERRGYSVYNICAPTFEN